mgnify:FL=1|jgi:hypothetical protein
MLTIPDLIAGILAACAMIGAYVIEWRRGNNAERIIALEARVDALAARAEAYEEAQRTIANITEAFERLRRNL